MKIPKTKKAKELQNLLAKHHGKVLSPIVNHVYQYLTDVENRYKLTLNHTDRGMGFDLHEPFKKESFTKGYGELGVYQIFINDIPYYTGEGIMNNRISRFCKAVLGENRYDEGHKAGDYIYKNIQNGSFNKDILNTIYVSYLSINDFMPMYESTNLKFTDITGEYIDTKDHIKNLSIEQGFNKSKPMTYYIEKIIMNKIGSILNTNNQSPSDIKYINERKFREKSFVSSTY